MKSVPHIEWWVAREPSPIHMSLIKEGLRRYKYFRGAKLTVKTTKEEGMVNTVIVSDDEDREIRPSEFLRMVQDETS
jgi:hypothetical protein